MWLYSLPMQDDSFSVHPWFSESVVLFFKICEILTGEEKTRLS